MKPKATVTGHAVIERQTLATKTILRLTRIIKKKRIIFLCLISH